MTEHDAMPVGHWSIVRRIKAQRGRARDVATDLFNLAYPALSVAIAVLTWPALIAVIIWHDLVRRHESSTAADRRAYIDGSCSRGQTSGALGRRPPSHGEAADSPTRRAS